MKKSTDKSTKSHFGITVKTLKYFFPLAWKKHKSFFFCGLLSVIVQAALPLFQL